ncbi:MAG: hypothetical protein JSW58_04760 [Candidatus Latescibacterota bacterium]|nr:MAG: hypothetical protein JSW58_04760 [Candidatus Latescibacterota bacterium]
MTGRRRVGPIRHLAAIAVLFLFCQHPSLTQASDQSSGTYGACFLSIPIGASHMSVPDVVAGMRPDASMVFSNPAVLAHLSRTQVFLSRANWLDDLSLNAASGVFPLRRYDINLSVGTRLLHSGELKGFDQTSQVVAEESYYGLSFSTALSKRFSSLGLSLGLGVTYLREHLPTETGDGFAMSLGASYERMGHRVEVFAQDLGGQISFDGRDYPVDSRYVLGYGHVFNRGWGRVDVGGQVTISRSQFKRFGIGAAYHFPRFFTLRSGIDHTFDAANRSQLPLSAGLGFRYGNFLLDYAYTSQEYFSSTHTFSVGFSFGAGGVGVVENKTTMGRRDLNPTGLPISYDDPMNTRVSQVSPANTPPASFAILAGVHSRVESARSEMRALRLLKVPAVVEKHGDEFKVLVGRYKSLEKANAELDRFESKGHRFTIALE